MSIDKYIVIMTIILRICYNLMPAGGNQLVNNKMNGGRPVVGLLATGSLVRRIMALGHTMRDQEAALLRPWGLTPVQRDVLVTLRAKGPLTASSLARLRGFSRQNARVLVAALRRKGFVQMVENPGHRRARLAEITPAGGEALQEIMHAEGEILARLAAAVGATEARSALATLDRLATAMG